MTAGYASLATRYSPTAYYWSRYATPDAEVGSSRPVTAPTATQVEFRSEMNQSPVNVMKVGEHAGHMTDNLDWDANAKAFLKFVSLLLIHPGLNIVN
jgi:hypothetical protein